MDEVAALKDLNKRQEHLIAELILQADAYAGFRDLYLAEALMMRPPLDGICAPRWVCEDPGICQRSCHGPRF